MLVIAGYLLLAPTERDRFVAQHLDLVARARLAPGCLDLAISSDPVNDARVNTFERWENEEALAAWRKIANSPQLDIEFLGGDMAKYHIDKTGPVF
ncbi:antibiotic biosynthesis monooxygenase [Salinibacterium sp. NSLL150]|nr:antibiotic biosynthesis monooxygenase family protein [Salinibacterium sp. NK8237]MBH0097981.1 antibiotic biosynthesis monooxygenase [Salinibacterium sp. NSLL35]MBH0100736.1 antibiotic biosynthesis monooxygenase [Salinibacterium sp. NSLL150]MBH0103495.1 antibiotic biosynthesis monooxygenase [Salinibacterium sp. NSLL16]MBH0106256.1 antibiotic biosynthesis monooxygenase [Salinibacterium sp. NSLL17]MBH0130242.1 antibiotic biosynthesis monooxygenase [Salinibacterium sp. NK8237]